MRLAALALVVAMSSGSASAESHMPTAVATGEYQLWLKTGDDGPRISSWNNVHINYTNEFIFGGYKKRIMHEFKSFEPHTNLGGALGYLCPTYGQAIDVLQERPGFRMNEQYFESVLVSDASTFMCWLDIMRKFDDLDTHINSIGAA